jgi:hypothetical protein
VIVEACTQILVMMPCDVENCRGNLSQHHGMEAFEGLPASCLDVQNQSIHEGRSDIVVKEAIVLHVPRDGADSSSSLVWRQAEIACPGCAKIDRLGVLVG